MLLAYTAPRPGRMGSQDLTHGGQSQRAHGPPQPRRCGDKQTRSRGDSLVAESADGSWGSGSFTETPILAAGAGETPVLSAEKQATFVPGPAAPSLGASRFCLWDLAESSRLARFPLREGGRGVGPRGPARPARDRLPTRDGGGLQGLEPSGVGALGAPVRAVDGGSEGSLTVAMAGAAEGKRPVGTKERPPRPRAMGSGRALCQETRWVLCFGRGRLCGLLRWPEGARGEDGAAAPLRAREGRPARRVGGGSFEAAGNLPMALETRQQLRQGLETVWSQAGRRRATAGTALCSLRAANPRGRAGGAASWRPEAGPGARTSLAGRGSPG